MCSSPSSSNLRDGDHAVAVGRVLAGVAIGHRIDQRLQLRCAQRRAREASPVAVLPVTLTLTVKPLVPVPATLLPSVSATSEPSNKRISSVPSVTLATVNVIKVKVWPDSTVEAVPAL